MLYLFQMRERAPWKFIAVSGLGKVNLSLIRSLCPVSEIDKTQEKHRNRKFWTTNRRQRQGT